ncbi:MAG: hypothetical protein ACYDH6_06715 [Acidimicrobiales bacterium]
MRSHPAGRISVTAALLVASAASLVLTSATAQAAAQAIPIPPVTVGSGGYGGYATGNIVGVTGVTIPKTLQVANIAVAPVTTAVSSTAGIGPAAGKNSYARAANLDADLLSGAIPIDNLIVEAKQSAPADNPTGVTKNLLSVPADPLLNATVADASANARWLGAQCVPVGTDIAKASSDVATANVLPGSPITVSVVNAAGGPVTSDSRIGLVNVTGSANKGLASTQIDQITGVVLFKGTSNELTVNVLAPPQIIATATGLPGGAKVTYTEPILQILQGKTVLGTLDAKSANTSITIPGLATLSLGQLTSKVAADGTSATGSASLLTVQIGIAPLPLNVATVLIAPAAVSAIVPAGGVVCPPNTNPLDESHKDASSADVAPGQQFTYTVTVPNRGTCQLTNVKVVDTITGPAGTTVVSSTPAASSTNGLTLTYNDIGPLAPNETKNIQIVVQAPANFTGIAQFHNHADISALCAGTTFTKGVDINAPIGFVPANVGCHLDDSNKAADHIKVFDGETFNYYIHVFNDGILPCSAVTVTDAVPANTTFVSASDGGTLTGGTVSWNIGTLASGASHTLVLTVKVGDTVPTGTALPNVAHIASPSEPNGVTVQAAGPIVSGISVLAGPNLPSQTGKSGLPVTGGVNSRFAPLGLGFLAAAFAAWGWRRRSRHHII